MRTWERWILNVWQCTFSTSLKTRRKFNPANFFKSSRDHILVARSVVKSSGYLETSSSCFGTLQCGKRQPSFGQFVFVLFIVFPLTHWFHHNWHQYQHGRSRPQAGYDLSELFCEGKKGMMLSKLFFYRVFIFSLTNYVINGRSIGACKEVRKEINHHKTVLLSLKSKEKRKVMEKICTF